MVKEIRASKKQPDEKVRLFEFSRQIGMFNIDSSLM